MLKITNNSLKRPEEIPGRDIPPGTVFSALVPRNALIGVFLKVLGAIVRLDDGSFETYYTTNLSPNVVTVMYNYKELEAELIIKR